ncbi:MAG TPA: hypothetical protein VH143_09255 [Kofleriaceae bacterium]|jgi:hypothetical protein|nr:hypothetical protein [Kofleriaceae bacterium]
MRWLVVAVVIASATARAETKCERGAAFAKSNDLPRAALYLDGCGDAEEARVDRVLEASKLSKLTIASDPPGLVLTIDALPGETITTPAIVWAKAGTYTITANGAKTQIHVVANSSMPILLDNHAPKPRAPRSGVVDIAAEPTETTTQPPDQPHPSLLPCKFTGCDTHDGEHLDDPFAARAERLPIAPPAFSIGARIGASEAFHAGGSRIAPAAALDARVHAGFGFVDARLDWARRGGDDGAFDAFGASAQYGAVIFAPAAAWLSAIAGVRGALRTDEMMDGKPIERAGIGYTAALELALRGLPITVGARYEEDLTDVIPGVRERAVIVELGGEFRAGLRY